VALAAGIAGCAHFHMDDGAPGSTDIAQPPRDRQRFQIEAADPPGERLLVVRPSLVGVLGRVPAGSDQFASGALGLELAVEWATSSGYHRLLPVGTERDFPLPERGFGLAAGWMPLTSSSPQGRFGGPLYGEARARLYPALSLGAGWFSRTDGSEHGPQLSLVAGPLLARAGHVIGGRVFAQIGVDVWATLVWVWSR
jgi:hypothetical protein